MKFKLIIDKTQEESVTVVAHAPSALIQELESLVYRYQGGDTLFGTGEHGMVHLSFSDIECVTILQRKVIAVDKNGTQYRLQECLRDLEQILPSYFIRINKSSLANEHRILRFETTFSGGVDVVFLCGYREYVSRRCFSDIKRRLFGK